MAIAIPFSTPSVGSLEQQYLLEVLANGKLGGDGNFSQRCQQWLESCLKAKRALLTHSCTAALEMAAILLDLKAGDEVILPSFTFVSTANAVVLRGAIPVFVDIDPRTQNIDPEQVREAITNKSRAIFIVHYAGVACEMEALFEISRQYGLALVEDAAQCMGAFWRGRALGTFGSFGALSFHETKNIASGEGGALIVNREDQILRAEIVREKGTDRTQYLRGDIDKYSWVDLGSSYLPSELVAAVLLAQLERTELLNHQRLKIWNEYAQALAPLADRGLFKLPYVPADCQHNGHIFYILLNSIDQRTHLIQHLKAREIASALHYVPLHNSAGGKKYGRTHGSLQHTERTSDRLLRLPIFSDFRQPETVIAAVSDFFR